MLVSFPNDVKIYNLSAGKSLPEWLSDRKRRKLLQDNVDLRRKIELIQDFEMPDCSTCVTMSKDGQYIYVGGTYKPRIRCFDVNSLSMKFERCTDSENIKTLILSDGYEKLVLLQEDRWLEFHVQYGRYFRMRIPKFGRDICYYEASCDLFIVGSGPEAYRLNLEQGRFMIPFTTSANSLTKCAVNSEHNLIMLGTFEGKVEAWDPRAKKCVGVLDSAINLSTETSKISSMPSVSCIKFKDGLHMAVGLATGQVLLYDLRSNKPYLMKDHRYDLPIRCVEFVEDMNLVMSMDNRVIKLWHESRDDAKLYTSIEPGVDLNDLHLIKQTGLFFVANEEQKVLTYYIPSLGPAPKWCSFLDNITEELEETDQPDVYDDYKFLTISELNELGMSHLIGTKMLRAYMHGYFIDVRLYNKAKSLANPFAYQEYRQRKVREKLDQERTNRVQIKALPKVNKQLAERLMTEEFTEGGEISKKRLKKQKAVAKSLLQDDRFKALFENPDFEVDVEDDEFQLLNPAMARLEKQKKMKQMKSAATKNIDSANEEATDDLSKLESDGDKDNSEDEDETDLYNVRPSSSSEDDEDYKQLVKKAHKNVTTKHKVEAKAQRQAEYLARITNEPQRAPPTTYHLKSVEDFQGWDKVLSTRLKDNSNSDKNVPLEERLNVAATEDRQTDLPSNAKEISFASQKSLKFEEKQRKMADHVRDRRKLRRSAATLKSKGKFA